MNSMSYGIRTVGFAAVFALAASTIVAAQQKPGVLRPWDDSGTLLDVGRPVGSAASLAPVGMQEGADHIIAQQCTNGGFGWPHDDCSTTFNNITGPICMGLVRAHGYTGDSAHLAAAVSGADYDLTFQYTNAESRFGSFTAHFLWEVSMATSDAQYMNHASTAFFDELTAGTYGPSDLDTAGWIAAVEAGRTGTWVNLRPWEFHNLIPTAAAIGNAGQAAAFEQALLDGLNTLDNTAPSSVYSDIIGLAGGVSGLAAAGTTSFPAIASPNHALINGITTLQDLADTLAGLQNGNGSWYWHSNLGAPTSTDEDTQTTAYALMALEAADDVLAADYSTQIIAARNWLLSMQTVTGGFMSWPGGTENTEVEGEALQALVVSSQTAGIPATSTWALAVMVLLGLVGGSVLFARSRAAVQ